jgi:hypothetical protein
MSPSWELHKDTLRTLYVDRDETLKSIMAHMRDVLGFTKKYGNRSLLRSLDKQLTPVQERPVRAAIQEMGLQQEQYSSKLENYRPQGYRAGETRQNECGSQRWQGNF